ncbi:unnamed protein product [Peronospora destructor]|uniref:Uncharacterized protein n=1 Tax=Peronospora destructor TaxID=86335 RepID=A0AAV0T0Y7_9STRA|nr:unnamed protein product [Peronospora destructor]
MLSPNWALRRANPRNRRVKCKAVEERIEELQASRQQKYVYTTPAHTVPSFASCVTVTHLDQALAALTGGPVDLLPAIENECWSQLNHQKDLRKAQELHAEDVVPNMRNRTKLDGLSFGASSDKRHRGSSNPLATLEDVAVDIGGAKLRRPRQAILEQRHGVQLQDHGGEGDGVRSKTAAPTPTVSEPHVAVQSAGTGAESSASVADERQRHEPAQGAPQSHEITIHRSIYAEI